MTLLKYLAKFLHTYQHEVVKSQTAKEEMKLKKSSQSTGTSNLIATTTIINKKRISKVVKSYSCLTKLKNPIITIHKNSYRTNNHFSSKLVPIAESSTISSVLDSDTLCNTCTNNKQFTKPKKYCKCCGKELIGLKKVNFNQELISKQYKQSQLKRLYNSNEIFKKKKIIKSIKNRSCYDCCKITRGYLKKSKGMTNMKQIEYKSFLSNKRKYSRAVSSTLQEDKEENLREKLLRKNMILNKGENKLDNKICSTFIVDFASTPVKLAPKTSTPVKLKLKSN